MYETRIRSLALLSAENVHELAGVFAHNTGDLEAVFLGVVGIADAPKARMLACYYFPTFVGYAFL